MIRTNIQDGSPVDVIEESEHLLRIEERDCEEDSCPLCETIRKKREAEEYADAQQAYYAPGSFFDTLFDGAFDNEK